MKKLNRLKAVPMGQQILWWAIRAALLIFGIYGLLHNSVTQFLMGLFAIAHFFFEMCKKNRFLR